MTTPNTNSPTPITDAAKREYDEAVEFNKALKPGGWKVARQLETKLQSALREADELKRCCDFTADGKPVKRGSTLFLYPANDTDREPMTLKVPEAIHYCWFNSSLDCADYIKNAMKEEK